jgi:hypothetical protein
VSGEVSFELIERKTAGLGQTIHAFADFDENEAFVCFGEECVLIDDGLRNGCQGDAHVFFTHHGCSQIKIFKVESDKTGVGSGDDAVQEQFYDGEVSSGGADFVGIMYKVPANGEANALGFGTFRDDEASIRCLTARWELVMKYISHGIRT